MIKNLYLAITVSMFALIVGQYSQIAIAQYPLILIYYALLAILTKLIRFDEDEPVRYTSSEVSPALS